MHLSAVLLKACLSWRSEKIRQSCRHPFNIGVILPDSILVSAANSIRETSNKQAGNRLRLSNPLTASETMPLLLNAPPMRGAEYLSANVLQNIRVLLDDWVDEQSQAMSSFDAFLGKHAPQWHQVGRVCFHLAENKNDADYPFAFMATYADEQKHHIRPILGAS